MLPTDLRQPTVSDVNYLMDIDIKCFDDPWPTEDWRRVFRKEIYKLVATYFGTPVGYVVWERTPLELAITRLAVKPAHRRTGVGSRLLQAVADHAVGLQLFKTTILVSESLCCPGDPRDATRWLLKKGFRASSIVKGAGRFLGKEEDAYLFSLIVKG